MASPNVAGVAAIIRSYYPLTASQVKHILMDSGVAITENVVVAGNQKTAVLLLLCLNQEK
jgi:subtilisin family serine protease